MKVLLVTHYLTSGPTDEWVKYLRYCAEKIVYIRHPFSYKEEDKQTSVTVYEGGEEKTKWHVPFPDLPAFFYYLKDAFLNQILPLIGCSKFDLCISADCLNTFSLLPLRKTGLIKKLVYYSIDYSPVRFENSLMNSIYHFIERQSCYHADLIWDLSPRMMEGRAKNGINISRCATRLIVPTGAALKRIGLLDINEIKRHSMVFLGHLIEKQGLQLVIQVLPEIKNEIPDVQLVIVGAGEYERALRDLSIRLGIENAVEFKGHIKNHEDVEGILCQCAIGLAPYIQDENSFTYYADPGKPKVYLGCGLPVVITRLPLIADEIEKEGAGIAIDYDAGQLKKALLSLLKDDAFYKQARENAIRLSERYDWNNICLRTLESSGYPLQ